MVVHLRVRLFGTSVVLVALCACKPHSEGDGQPMSTKTTAPGERSTGQAASQSGFLASRDIGRFATTVPSQYVYFGVPSRVDGRVVVVVMVTAGNLALPSYTAEEKDFIRSSVWIPDQVIVVDAKTQVVLQNRSNVAPDYFGLPVPPEKKVGRFYSPIVGRYDDPRRPPEPFRASVRERIYDVLDVLLPFFADDVAFSPEAAKAAAEFRDLFPHVCEPGLLPYYMAVAPDFFAWVDKNASGPKTPLPWDVPGIAPSASVTP